MRTKRLVLRPLQRSDAKRIAELAGDWDVARMTARIPFPYAEVQALEWIEGLYEGEVVRAIEHEGTLVGLVGYMPQDKGAAEIGYWIGKPYWGHGYATEAAQAMMRHCFGEVRLSRLTCCHFADNPASERVIAKLGFRRTGMCKAYSEARQAEAATVRYERKRPLTAVFWRRAA